MGRGTEVTLAKPARCRPAPFPRHRSGSSARGRLRWGPRENTRKIQVSGSICWQRLSRGENVACDRCRPDARTSGWNRHARSMTVPDFRYPSIRKSPLNDHMGSLPLPLRQSKMVYPNEKICQVKTDTHSSSGKADATGYHLLSAANSQPAALPPSRIPARCR
jgi:hypothetical protein